MLSFNVTNREFVNLYYFSVAVAVPSFAVAAVVGFSDSGIVDLRSFAVSTVAVIFVVVRFGDTDLLGYSGIVFAAIVHNSFVRIH